MRAHSANFTRSVKHTFDHIYSHITGQFTTPRDYGDGEQSDRQSPGISASLNVRAGSRHYFTAEHLWTAQRMATSCQEREGALLAQGFQDIDIEQRSLCVTTVFASVAFLEALVNEVWLDASVTDPGIPNARLAALSEDMVACLKAEWSAAVDRLCILDKYEKALGCMGQPRISKGAEPFQSAQTVIDLRNALVHFKPELQWEDEVHKLESALKSKIVENPLLSPDTRPWYPHKALSAGCAEWAWKSCVAFADEWWKRMGLTRDYKDFGAWPAP